MKSPYMPPVIQAVGLACVPITDMQAGSTLARKPVAAAVLTLSERDDGHRDLTFKIISDVQPLEFPLPVSINDALIAGAPTIITEGDRGVLTIEATSRRFFVEPKLAALAMRCDCREFDQPLLRMIERVGRAPYGGMAP